MNAYEIMLLLDSELADERQNEILTRARELVEQRRRRLGGARALGPAQARLRDRPKPEAFYHLLHFDCDAETLDELTRVLKITDGACGTWPCGAAPSGRPARPRGRPAGRVG